MHHEGESELSSATSGRYRVGMVSRLTGLSTHTLRMWERRHEAVVPERTEAGGRLYSEADVERLRLLKHLVDEGHSIGGIAPLPAEELRAMKVAVTPSEPRPSLPVSSDVLALRKSFLDSVYRFEMEEAEQLLARAALTLEPRSFLVDLVHPTLEEVGRRWETKDFRIVHEHAASAVVRNLLATLGRMYPRNPGGKVAVVTTPAGELHEFGALMAALLAAMHGYRTLYLGPNLPVEEIVCVTEEVSADLLLLSVVHAPTEQTTQALRDTAKKLAGKTTILVGGRAAHSMDLGGMRLIHHLSELDMTLARIGR